MTKQEFIDRLKRALSSSADPGLIAENESFYSQYIDGELNKGRSLDDIMAELGDPRLIANSILQAAGYREVEGSGNTAGNNAYSDTTVNGTEEETDNASGKPEFRIFSGKKLLLILILVFLVIFVIVGSFFRLLGGIFGMNPFFTVLIIALIIGLVRRRFR